MQTKVVTNLENKHLGLKIIASKKLMQQSFERLAYSSRTKEIVVFIFILLS